MPRVNDIPLIAHFPANNKKSAVVAAPIGSIVPMRGKSMVDKENERLCDPHTTLNGMNDPTIEIAKIINSPMYF